MFGPQIDPTKDLPKPPKNMNIRKFQWQFVPVRQYKESFWSKTQEEHDKGKNPVIIDFDNLQQIFCEEKKKPVNKEIVKSTNISKKQANILDGKRLMNVSISKSSFRKNRTNIKKL